MAETDVGAIGRRIAQLREYRTWAEMATQQTGKSLASQAREILELKSYGGQCGITDYYWHKLYDDNYLEGRGRRDFLGWRLLQEFSLALNPRYAVLPAWDKIVFEQVARDYGLPVVPTLAFFHPALQSAQPSGIHLGSLDAAQEFLRDRSHYPLFCKPAFSQGGHGTAFVQHLDESGESLVMLDGKHELITDFVGRLEQTVSREYHKPQCGFLFQKPLKPAAEIQRITGWTSVCSVRVVCLNGSDGAKPVRAAWKISVPPNHTDNFGMGDHGNLLANVDLQTGRINKTIGGFWPNTQVFANHPRTGLPLEGFQLPGWPKVLELCALGGKVFPLMKVHHWDFALTDAGPVIMELNDIGGTQISQMHGHGLLTESTRAFLLAHANTQAHPWTSRL